MSSIRNSMIRALCIAQRELASMFRVPAGWIIIALFVFLTGLLFVNQTIIPGNPGTLRYFFMYAGWLLIPIAPAISMRLMSEEYRSGSFESLRTAPASDWAVTLGKYLGSLGFLGLMLVPSLMYPTILMIISDPAPDLGPIFAGYLMLLLVGMFYLSIGMLASSLTSSQALAFLATLMSLILIMVVTSSLTSQVSVQLGIWLRSISITDRIGELAKGVIDTATIAFFLIGTLWMLSLATAVLEIKRLGKSKLYTISTAVLFIMISSVCVYFASYITQNHHARFDVTATGDHRLSERSIQIVDRVGEPTEIVLAAGFSTIDRRTLDLVEDVLDAYDRSSDQIRVRMINLDAAEGIEESSALLADLAFRERDQIDLNTEILSESTSLMAQLSSQLDRLADGLIDIRDAIIPRTSTDSNNKAVFDQRAPIVRVFARDLNIQANQIQLELDEQKKSLTDQATPNQLLPFDRLNETTEQTLAKLKAQLDSLTSELEAFTNANDLAVEPRLVARPIAELAKDLYEQTAVTLDRINRMEPINAIRVGRVLETGEALLVIGEPQAEGRSGIAAVDLDSLFISSSTLEQAGISAAGVIGPRAQDLIGTAILQIVAPTQPILIYMHGGNQGDLLETTELFTKSTQRLAQRGIDTIEWAAIEEPTPPDLSELDPLGIRPIVFALISVDSTSRSDQSGLTGAKRASEMGAIVNKLVEQGESVLISLNPSIFPTYNEPDPLAQALGYFGMVPNSGRTLMHNAIGKTGQRIADTRTFITPDVNQISSDTQHPIAHALNGLNMMLPWAVSLDLNDSTIGQEHVQHWPILVFDGESDPESSWEESNWNQYWSTPAQSRHLLTNQPEFHDPGESKNSKDSRSSQYIIAAAGQRELAGSTQRMMVVGSNGWSSDAITADAQHIVDGRVLSRWPGNETLLDSSIAWLAGMDDLIGAGTQAKPIATIQVLEPRTQSMLRWMTLAGMPGLILLIGMGYRLAFG